MNRIVMLRLRNRTLNRFKKLKTSPKVKKAIIKKTTSGTKSALNRGKTLRVVPKNASSLSKVRPQKYGKIITLIPTSPVSSGSCRNVFSFSGQNRLFLRNRRLMHMSPSKAICAF